MTAISLTRTAGLARWNAVLLTRNRLALVYALALPMAPLGLLLTAERGDVDAGATASLLVWTSAALFPVFYNVLSQCVSRRDELLLKRLRAGEARDVELLAALALPGAVVAVATVVVAVPVAMALGQRAPLNLPLYAVTALITVLLFAAFAFWTAAWTRNAEAAQLTSMPVILLAVIGQMGAAVPGEVRRWLDLTPGGAMAHLVPTSWFGVDGPGSERTPDLAATWTGAVEPLLVLVAWTALALWLAARSMRWEPRS